MSCLPFLCHFSPSPTGSPSFFFLLTSLRAFTTCPLFCWSFAPQSCCLPMAVFPSHPDILPPLPPMPDLCLCSDSHLYTLMLHNCVLRNRRKRSATKECLEGSHTDGYRLHHEQEYVRHFFKLLIRANGSAHINLNCPASMCTWELCGSTADWKVVTVNNVCTQVLINSFFSS